MKPVVQVQELSCRMGSTQALDAVSLALFGGQRVALLGPNGAGKSSLMRVITGQLRPDSGTVKICGAVAGSEGAREYVGLIPQRLALFPKLSARKNLEVFARLSGMAAARARDKTSEALAWIGLEGRSQETLSKLSGGMQRRVSIACGAIHNPRILLADEPMVGVDAHHREPLEKLFKELRQSGTAILESTHQLDAVDSRFDQVVVMNRGCVVAAGNPADVIASAQGLHHRIRITLSRGISGVTLPGLTFDGRTVSGSLSHAPEQLGAVLDQLSELDAQIQEIEVQPPSLEAFVKRLEAGDQEVDRCG